MFSGKRSILIVLAWWLLWAVFHAWILNAAGFSTEVAASESLVSTIYLAMLSAAVSYPVKYYRPRDTRLLFLVVWATLLAIVWVFLVNNTMELFEFGNSYEVFLDRSSKIRTVIGFLILSAFITISYLVQHTRSNREEEAYRLKLEKQAKDAELFSLRQQLQPHFLFNTLNSINALIGSRPEEAREMTRKLSSFLRGTLTGVSSEKNSLKEELNHLQLYLDIEKVRFGNRLKTSIACTEDHTDIEVPSLLLQPLVENAIKFGLYDTLGDVEIVISCRRENDDLLISITNPFDPETTRPNKGTGFGLSSVQRKLYLIYNRQDLVETRVEKQTYIVTVRIPG